MHFVSARLLLGKQKVYFTFHQPICCSAAFIGWHGWQNYFQRAAGTRIRQPWKINFILPANHENIFLGFERAL
jgi:hypothetical protein